MASGSNQPSGPSGRSPFPPARNPRTRLSRPSFGEAQPSVDGEAHSPFLQGLLRFSPNNSTATTNHWSPAQRGVTASARRASFFGGSSYTNAAVSGAAQVGTVTNKETEADETQKQSKAANATDNTNQDSNNVTDIPSLPTAVVDGIPLDHLRALAQESLRENYPSQATFFASLLYAKTSHPSDALLLAKAQLMSSSTSFSETTTPLNNATACLRVLDESGLLQSRQPWQGLLVACAALAAQGEWPSVVELLDDACRLPDDDQNNNNNSTRHNNNNNNIMPIIQDDDDFAWHALQQVIGEAQQQQSIGNSTNNTTTMIHWFARICTWRGRAFHETGNGPRAALYWKRALMVDCRCQEAWESLLERNLLTAAAAYALVQENLEFGPDLEWLKALYLARIELAPQETAVAPPPAADPSFSFSFGKNLDASAIPFTSPPTAFQFQTPSAGVGLPANNDKADNDDVELNTKTSNLLAQMQEEVDAAFDQLWNKYKLQNSPHVLAMAARRAHRRYDWKTALSLCESLAQLDPHITGAAFCYLSTLVKLGHKRVLFRLAHEWVESSPRSARAWFAVGSYYYCCERYHVAQRHFCRATRLDPQCTPAWIAFGCAFAACDESDQALASFRAAQRLSPGEHTSLLYMGMEYVRTNHLVLAEYFLKSALASSGGDPLCLHELGVLHAQKGESETAISWLERALAVASGGDSVQESLDLAQDPYWEPTLFSLGHCYRRTRQFDKAEACFCRCVALCPEKASTYAALAFTKHLVHDLDGAINFYHQALSLKSDDPFSTEMFQRALQEQASSDTNLLPLSKEEEEEKERTSDKANIGHSLFGQSPDWKGDSSAMSMDVDMSDPKTP